MKLIARATPYSTSVGGGITLFDESGKQAFIVAFIGTVNGITREQTEALARRFKQYVDEYGLDIP